MKKRYIIILIVVGLLVVFYFIGKKNPLPQFPENGLVHLDSIADITIPDFVERPLDPNLTTNWKSPTAATYYWEGKTYTDFEGSGHSSPWHLIVSIYKDSEAMKDTTSFLVDEASGFMWTKDYHQVEGVFDIGGGDTTMEAMVRKQAESFVPFQPLSDGVDIQTMNFPYKKYATEDVIDTYIVLVTDDNKHARVLINVPQENYSLQQAVDLAQQTMSSVVIHDAALDSFFQSEKTSFPYVPADIEKNAISALKQKFNAIDPQIMNNPVPDLSNNVWTFTAVDISQQISFTGVSTFLVSANAKTSEIIAIIPSTNK